MKDEDPSKTQGDENHPELVLKVLLVGAPKSGKTSFVRRLCDKPFREEYVPTLGFDLIVVPYGTYQGRPVSLQLWDVAGSQLKARPCHHALIASGADGVLYVLDVTSRDSLQAVDEWDRALSKYLPPWSSKLLVGHKADLPVYVVNDEALSLYVAGAEGFRGWCLTVGNSDYGDYDVAARRGGGGGWGGDGGGRYKGQNLSGEKQLSVSEAVRTLVGHVFRSGNAGAADTTSAGVVGLGASANASRPVAPTKLDEALGIVHMLGLGCQAAPVGDSVGRGGGDGDDSGDGGGDPTNFGDATGGAVPSREGAVSMRELLRRGRAPVVSGWRERREPLVQRDREQKIPRGDPDPGWKYFAGRLGREEAESLLRGRTEGTFFLRRKSPSMLVLTYVAKSDQSASRKSVGGTPSQALSTPDARGAAGEESARRITVGGDVPVGGVSDAGRDWAPEGVMRTSVQHALLVYEGGFFSDEKARLGRFSTLRELLDSKISAIARYPLTFRRERERYVLVEESSEGEAVPVAETASANMPPVPVVNSGAPFRDASATAPKPVLPEGLFKPRAQQGAPSLSPLASTADHRPQGATLPIFPRAERPSRRQALDTGGGPGSASPGDWGERQVRPNGARSSASATGGSLWMEAAAAKQKTGSTSSGGVKTRRRTTRAAAAGSGRPRTSSFAGAFSSGTRPRSSPRKGSTSSMEDGSVSSTATGSTESDRGSLFSDRFLQLQQPQQSPHHQQQQQHPWKGSEKSAMAAAAEAAELSAATVATTTSHPQAKPLLERLLAAGSTIEIVTEAFEEQMRPVSGRAQSDWRVNVHSVTRGLPPETLVPSPRAGSGGCFALSDGDEFAPRFDSVASLLVKRMLSSRDELLGSMSAIRERVVALAVVEGPGGGNDGRVVASGSVAGSRNFAPLSNPISWSPLSRTALANVNARVFAGERAEEMQVPPVLSSKDAERASPIDHGSASNERPGLSTCGDFERILGEVKPASEVADESKGDAGSALREPRPQARADVSDAGSSNNASASSGAGRSREQREESPGAGVGGSETWGGMIAEVQSVEERCRVFVAEWKSVGGVMANVCMDGFEGQGGFDSPERGSLTQ